MFGFGSGSSSNSSITSSSWWRSNNNNNKTNNNNNNKNSTKQQQQQEYEKLADHSGTGSSGGHNDDDHDDFIPTSTSMTTMETFVIDDDDDNDDDARSSDHDDNDDDDDDMLLEITTTTTNNNHDNKKNTSTRNGNNDNQHDEQEEESQQQHNNDNNSHRIDVLVGGNNDNNGNQRNSRFLLNTNGTSTNYDDDDRIVSVMSIDDAIEHIGYGPFQLLVLLASGLCFAADAMQVVLLSFLTLVLEEEWNLSQTQTSSITSCIFGGAMVGTLLFGPLADIYGRRPIFLISAMDIFIFGICTGIFTTNYTTLMIYIFCIGIGIGGLTVPFDILAEFLPSHGRGTNLLYIEYFWTIGCLYVVAIAYTTLSSSTTSTSNNGNNNNTIDDNDTNMNRWRMMMMMMMMFTNNTTITSMEEEEAQDLYHHDYYDHDSSITIPLNEQLVGGSNLHYPTLSLSSIAGWRIFVCLCALPCFLSFIIGYCFVPESARWLVTQGRYDEAKTVIRRAAIMNGNIWDVDSVFSSNVIIRSSATTTTTTATRSVTNNNNNGNDEEEEEVRILEEEEEEHREGTIFDLFTPKWFYITLRLWGTWAAFAFAYYGVIMTTTRVFASSSSSTTTTSSSSSDQEQEEFDYSAIFVSSSAELVGTTLVIIAVDRFGRISSQIVSYALAGICFFLLCILSSSSSDHHQDDTNNNDISTPSTNRTTLIIFGFAARVFEMAGTCTTWVSTAEILTTEVRGTGHSTANAMARLGAFFCPFLVENNNISLRTIGVVMLLVHVIIISCIAGLPETNGKSMGMSPIPTSDADEDVNNEDVDVDALVPAGTDDDDEVKNNHHHDNEQQQEEHHEGLRRIKTKQNHHQQQQQQQNGNNGYSMVQQSTTQIRELT